MLSLSKHLQLLSPTYLSVSIFLWILWLPLLLLGASVKVPMSNSLDIIPLGRNVITVMTVAQRGFWSPKKAFLPEVEESMERSYLERNSLRTTGRIFGVSHGTVFNKVKKARDTSAFKTTIIPATKDDILEADELFTFVYMKVNQIHIWIVQCRRTRQILSFFIGDGASLPNGLPRLRTGTPRTLAGCLPRWTYCLVHGRVCSLRLTPPVEYC